MHFHTKTELLVALCTTKFFRLNYKLYSALRIHKKYSVIFNVWIRKL